MDFYGFLFSEVTMKIQSNRTQLDKNAKAKHTVSLQVGLL